MKAVLENIFDVFRDVISDRVSKRRYAVVNVETTGSFPKLDRLGEIKI